MLFDPYQLADIKLKNRVVMAPLTRGRADNNHQKANALIAEYYRQRASAGLIVTEGSQISPMGIGYHNTPGIHTTEQIEGWKLITKAVHDAGGKIFIQLWHVGRMSHPYYLNGNLPIAPSAINPGVIIRTPAGKKPSVIPREMTHDDIKEVIADFAQAAANAMEAGFDGVEIHSSNGYLLHQFFAPDTNKRSDEYGGSIPNRARLLFEVLNAMKTKIPVNRIGVRLNPSAHQVQGIKVEKETIPTFDYIINHLNNYNLAYLHLSEPFTDVSTVTFAESNIAQRYRPIYKGNLMINKGFTGESAEKIIAAGLADMVAFGVPFIANPDLVYRMQHNIPLSKADPLSYYTTGEKGFTDYPTYH